jgi:hypothetical protein
MFIRMNESRNLASANRCTTNADALSNSSTPRIGYKNVRILRVIRLGQPHRRWNADSFSMPQVMQIGSSIRLGFFSHILDWRLVVSRPKQKYNQSYYHLEFFFTFKVKSEIPYQHTNSFQKFTFAKIISHIHDTLSGSKINICNGFLIIKQ